MVEYNHDIKSFNADTLIKGNHGVIVSVYVSNVGGSGAKCVFKNGTTSSGYDAYGIGERIRDIEYYPNGNFYILVLESTPSFGILTKK